MNRELNLFHGVFILPGYRQLMDDLGRVPPHDVGAQDLAVLLVAQDLHEPFGLTGATRPAVGRERKPARYVVDLPLLALILGEPDAGHLRMAVGHTGHVVVPDRVGLLARDELRDTHALPPSFVSEHRRPGPVPNSVIARRAGLQVLVDLDEAT